MCHLHKICSFVTYISPLQFIFPQKDRQDKLYLLEHMLPLEGIFLLSLIKYGMKFVKFYFIFGGKVFVNLECARHNK